MKFDVNKLEILLYRTAWKVFRYLKRFKRGSRLGNVTDRRTVRQNGLQQ